MGDESDEGDEDNENKGQEKIQPPSPEATPPPAPPAPETVSKADFDKLMAKLTELEKFKSDAETAALSAEEKQRLELQKREEQLKQQEAELFSTNVKLAATQAGFRHPGDAERLIDWGKVKKDDPAAVTGAIEALKKARPELVGAAATPTSPGNPGRQSSAGATLTLEQIKAMTPEQVNSNWAAVQAALKG